MKTSQSQIWKKRLKQYFENFWSNSYETKNLWKFKENMLKKKLFWSKDVLTKIFWKKDLKIIWQVFERDLAIHKKKKKKKKKSKPLFPPSRLSVHVCGVRMSHFSVSSHY